MLIALLSLSAAMQAAPPEKALRGKSRPDTIILLDSVITAERHFLAQWGEAWKASEGERHTFEQNPSQYVTVRGANIQCVAYPESSIRAPDDAGIGPVIPSGVTGFNVCPSWFLGGTGEAVTDERVGIDGALVERRRPAVATARQALLGLIEQGVRAMPSNAFLVGQQVRFLVDAGDLRHAVDGLAACRSNRWWCAALSGYVLARAGNIVGADSSFAAMLAAQTPAERCQWMDVRVLLTINERMKYEKGSCAQREEASARLLWLADPLFSRGGNERRVEHFVRKVTITLHSALDRDERYDWRPQVGGNARAEMVERYGWPSYAYWGGKERDRHESRLLSSSFNRLSPPNEPYTTYEYTRGRQHLVPTLAAALDPFHAGPNEWAVGSLPAVEVPSRADPLWFPIEHFASLYSLTQFTDGQVALFRRQENALLATATRIQFSQLEPPFGAPIEAVALMASSAPDSFVRVAEAQGTVGSVVVLTGLIETRPAVISIEAPRLDDRSAGRVRFGVTPPLPLSAMKPGELAISDPVILRAPPADRAVPTDADSALALMAGSTRLSSGQIGVYWETYGFKPTDTVDVAVWIERHTPQGIIRNLGIVLKVSTDLNTPVSLGWREPQSDHRVHVTDGPVPTIGRSLQLDTSTLPKGEYWLDIAVGKPGSQPVRGRRNFSVQ